MVALSDPLVLLTVEDVAEVLGRKATSTWVLIRTGEIPSVRIGRLRRVRLADLEAYIRDLPLVAPTHPDNPGVPDGGGGNTGTGPGREAA